MQLRENGCDVAKTRFFSNDRASAYFEQVIGEPGLKQTCQQEESYIFPIGIMIIAAAIVLRASVVREGRM